MQPSPSVRSRFVSSEPRPRKEEPDSAQNSHATYGSAALAVLTNLTLHFAVLPAAPSTSPKPVQSSPSRSGELCIPT